MAERYFLVSLGCPKNQADSREMERSLLRSGFEPAESPEQADVIVINSCAFTTEASEETIETVFEALQWKEDQKSDSPKRVVLAGCFAQRYSEAISREIPELDLSFGTGRYEQTGPLVAEMMGESTQPTRSRAYADRGVFVQTLTLPAAPLKLSEGCDRGCSFCAIPSFRGPFQSLSEAQILEEARRLVDSGVREIDLVSQDTVQFAGGDPARLFDLIEQISMISGLEWIRLLYLYPDRKLSGILDQWEKRQPKKLVPYLESPVQHVSSHLLKAMGRSGSWEQYRDLFQRARSVVPDLEIRTSIILGFPGETHADVEMVEQFLRETGVEKLSLFGYSPQEGTGAYGLGKGEVDTEDRINRIRSFHTELALDSLRKKVGHVYRSIMVDQVSDEGIMARRAQDAPEIDGVVLLPVSPGVKPGDMIDVRITGVYEFDMEGELVKREGPDT